jgi:hypothetical protein
MGVAASAVFTAAPMPANAALTLGSDLSAANGTTACSDFPPATCTFIHSELPGRQLTAPFDGVIVRWRLRQNFEGDYGPMRLRVAQQQSGTTFRGVRSTPTVNPPSVAGSGTPTTHVIESQLPIAAGEFIGLDLLDNCCVEIRFGAGLSAAAVFWIPALGDGEVRSGTSISEFEPLFNADVEPDADCDALGDETQDPSVAPPGDCPQPATSKADRSVTLDANKNKLKKGKNVLLSGRIVETRQDGSCAANQVVELQRKKPSKSTFKTVETVQTDAAGNFTDKEKVKKTFQYRAQVSETATCAAGISNTEKVKVKKPK